MSTLLATKSTLIRRFQRRCLANMGDVEVAEAMTIVDVMTAVKERSVDLILTDWLPGEGGLTLISEVRESDSRIQIVMVTDDSAVDQILTAWDAGFDGYVLLPADPDEFCKRIEKYTGNRLAAR